MEEILNKVSELLNQIGSLEKELENYIDDEEASEPIKYNIDKREWEIEELLQPIKEELKQKEEEKDNKIEEITKKANERIERLEKELENYKDNEEASEPIQYNIDKIRWELEEKINDINKQYETEKNDILRKIEEVGISLEGYNLTDELDNEEKETEKTEESNEVIEEEKVEQSVEKPEAEELITEEEMEELLKISPAVKTIKNPVSYVESNKEKTDVQGSKSKEDIQEVDIDNNNVRIVYNAKTDEYTIININANKVLKVSRNELEAKDSTKILEDEDVTKSIDNVDINVIKLLSIYDNKFQTNKTEEYIGVAGFGKSAEERKNQMEDCQIDIKYNLKGLYDKIKINSEENEEAFSKKERQEILRLANTAKAKGMASVKKGIYVKCREVIENISDRFKNMKLLSSGRDEQEEREEYDKELEENYRIAEEAEKEAERIEKIKEEVKNNPVLQDEIKEATTCTSKENADWAEQFQVEIQSRRQQFTESVKAEPNVDDVMKILKEQGFKQVDREGNEIGED